MFYIKQYITEYIPAEAYDISCLGIYSVLMSGLWWCLGGVHHVRMSCVQGQIKDLFRQ